MAALAERSTKPKPIDNLMNEARKLAGRSEDPREVRKALYNYYERLDIPIGILGGEEKVNEARDFFMQKMYGEKQK